MDRGKRNAGAWLSLIALVVLYIAIRTLHLDLFVTTDEPFWLGRSANFYRALAHGDLVHTYQMAHPGVLTMWAGTLAYAGYFPDYIRDISANVGAVYGIGDTLRELGGDPLTVLVAARVTKILLQAVFFVISLRLIRSLFDPPVMILTGGLIALNPFLSGLDSLLHVDGLFAITSFAAILAVAAVVRAERDAIAPWLLAGALAACAWMTRATGLALVLVVAVVGLVQVVRIRLLASHRSIRATLEPPAFSVLLWMTGAAAASVLLLPALWVDPFGTMQQVWDWSRDAASDGHERPTFFLGRIYTGDPGWLFYPVTLLWRLTPVAIAGVAALLAMLPLARRRGWLTRHQRQSLLILAGFAILYLLVMTVGAKKFDRYISPVYPVIDLFAAVGIVLAVRWITGIRPDWRRVALPLAAGVVLVAQAGFLITSLPYRLDFYNPLLGGIVRAQDVVQVGWGEGGGEAMAFIIEDAAGRDVVVQKSSATPVLSWFATPNVHFEDFGLDSPAGWYETDYFVAGIQQWQRDMSPAYLLLEDHEPVDEVRVHDVPFFRTYTPRELPLPDELLGLTGCSAVFGDHIRLMQIVGRENTVALYWLTIGPAPADLDIRVTFISPDTGTPEVMRSTILQPAGDGLVSRAIVDDPRGEGDPSLDRYVLGIEVRDPATGDILPATFDGAPVADGAFYTHAGCFDS